MKFDHFIFEESIRIIQAELGPIEMDQIQQRVLERLIHASGDFQIKHLLKFRKDACHVGISALQSGAPILTDTYMAKVAIESMAKKTTKAQIFSCLDWATAPIDKKITRTSIGMKAAWEELSQEFAPPQSPLVVIGSSPTALHTLLTLISQGSSIPSLIVGMPVGFVGVIQSKLLLSQSNCPHIILEGTRGGAGLAAATVNALLKASIS